MTRRPPNPRAEGEGGLRRSPFSHVPLEEPHAAWVAKLPADVKAERAAVSIGHAGWVPAAQAFYAHHGFEQLLPRSAWGMRFFTSPINGVNGSSYRILADVDNTNLTVQLTVARTSGSGAPW